MALNLTRRLFFQRCYIHPPRLYPRTHHTRHFTNATKRAIDDFAEAAIPKSEGIRVLSHLERLTAVETEVSIHQKAITDGFAEIKGWVKMMVGMGGGTIIFGFGSLAYKVMVYDVAAKEEMMAHTERVVRASEEKTQARIESLERGTQAQTENLKLWTTSEINKLGHLLDLSSKKR
ncbi:hypothetical protein HOY82DRAFT_610689 [Tuber indicum]|nr:hypothetical protein HOY82DRAFT_610689 [Tuber indicum]